MPTSTSDTSGGAHQHDLRAAFAVELKAEARQLGFDAVGFASAVAAPADSEHLNAFVDAGRHGDMGWMAERMAQRAAPQVLWPAARSVIALGMNYGPDVDPLAARECTDRGVISVYARGRDYHTIVKKRLKRLARWMVARGNASGFDIDVKVFVDTAPVMEKPLAARAGLGWQGRHSNVVSRSYGSWLFLGEIYTTFEFAPDPPAPDSCGQCTRCIDICPTEAIIAPGVLDARRCISYLTIEHKGHIPSEFRAAIGNRVYGCDDCLAICPWNKFARTASEAGLLPRDNMVLPLLADLAALDDAAFRQLFTGSAAKRLGRDRFVRNVLVAIGNSRDTALATCAEARLGDTSPLVRAMAIWALGRLAPVRAKALRATFSASESDEDVRAEWRQIAD